MSVCFHSLLRLLSFLFKRAWTDVGPLGHQTGYQFGSDGVPSWGWGLVRVPHGVPVWVSRRANGVPHNFTGTSSVSPLPYHDTCDTHEIDLPSLVSVFSRTMADWMLVVVLLFIITQVGATSAPTSLADAIRDAIQPILHNLSQFKTWETRQTGVTNVSWGFAYMDANTSVQLCAGFSNNVTQTLCDPINDRYAFGSTTKTTTAVLILRLLDQGKIGSLDESIVTHANSYLRKISGGKSDLIEIFGPMIHNLTLRHLLSMHSGIPEYDNGKSARFATISVLSKRLLSRCQYVGQTRDFQNKHQSEDLSPEYILNLPNVKKWEFPPGARAHYSSTNYVLLGLVVANYQQAADWDRMNQREWVPNSTGNAFESMRFGIHGKCRNFSGSNGKYDGSTISGYQGRSYTWRNVDVRNLSVTQGWTCGNLVARPLDVAHFFWSLLGPGRQSTPLMSNAALSEMLDFQHGPYFDGQGEFSYGLGLMNFSTMLDWGFNRSGLFYGHNGLTYGFGAQSGYNYEHQFAVSWVNNNELWIGPNHKGQPDELYSTLVRVVQQHRRQHI